MLAGLGGLWLGGHLRAKAILTEARRWFSSVLEGLAGGRRRRARSVRRVLPSERRTGLDPHRPEQASTVAHRRAEALAGAAILSWKELAPDLLSVK